MAVDGNRTFQAVIDRIKSARGLGSNKEVAELLGLSASNLGERKSRGALPRDEIDELCKAARLNPDWVYEGRGEPLLAPVAAELKKQLAALKASADLVVNLDLPTQHRALITAFVHAVTVRDLPQIKQVLRHLDMALVPQLEVSASAGDGSVVNVKDEDVVDVLAFKPEWLRAIGVPHNRLAVISVRGDSMAETLHDGDLILVDTSIVERKSPGVYVIFKNDSLLVKRLNFKMNGSVDICSDNKAYPMETLSAAEFEQLHLVGRMARRVVR